MNIHIYLENDLGQKIQAQAKMLGKSRNAIVREAIREWLMHHAARSWPPTILKFQGVSHASRFESHRRELIHPKDDPFK